MIRNIELDGKTITRPRSSLRLNRYIGKTSSDLAGHGETIESKPSISVSGLLASEMLSELEPMPCVSGYQKYL